MTTPVGRNPPPRPSFFQRMGVKTEYEPRDLLNAAADATKIVPDALAARDSFREGPRNLRDLGRQALQPRQNWRSAVDSAAAGSNNVFDRGELAGRAVRTARQVTSAYNLPGTVSTAVQNVRRAAATGSREDVTAAIRSSAEAVNDTAQVAQHTAELARDANRFGRSYTAARRAYTAAAPGAPAAARRTAARVAVDSMRGRTRDAMQQRAVATARRAAPQAAQRATTVAAVRAARAGRAAQTLVAASRVARTAGRFVPGANIAIAVADTATAVATLRDPNASFGRRAASVVTAIGSIAAATNIPVVSQVGAAVSTVSSFVGAWFR